MTGAKRSDRQGQRIGDLCDGTPRPGSPARNGPLLTLKAAIGASSAGSGRPMGAKNLKMAFEAPLLSVATKVGTLYGGITA